MTIEFIISKSDDVFSDGDFLSSFDKSIMNILDWFNQKRVVFYPNSNSVYCFGFSYFKHFQLKRLFKQHQLNIEKLSQTTLPPDLYYIGLLEVTVQRYIVKINNPEKLYFKLFSMQKEFLKLQ